MNEERIPQLFEEAAALEGTARRALLDRLRRDEPELAIELERLLATEEEEPSPIDGAPVRFAAAIPDRVGSYRLLRELGQGGMGRVFLAEQETPDFRRTVALKLIDRPAAGEQAVRRFRDEVRILAALDHPGIVRFLDGGQSPEGVWYLALEYVEGTNLVRHAKEQELDPRERCRLLLAVAEAVAYAHGRGVIHRDIKPGNLLVGADGRPRLLDFGVSKLLDPAGRAATITAEGSALAFTPAYASPEQFAGGAVTTASDVYALGVVLHELLTGARPSPPGTGSNSESTARGRMRRDLAAICERALRLDPATRTPDAATFAAELRRYLEGRPTRVRGGRTAVLSLGVAAALVVTLVTLFARRSDRLSVAGERLAGASASRAATGFPFDPVNPPQVEELEPLFAAFPEDAAVGAALACRLAKERRYDEAQMIVGRLRQIPGHESDPLVDYAAGRVAHLRKERQAALVFFTRARDSAADAGHSDFLPEIHGLRGSALAAVGQRDEAIAELERAVALAESAGFDAVAYRSSNDLAIEYLQRGDLEAGESRMVQAIAAAERAGLRPLVALGNLSELLLQRGRPDLAEPRLTALLDLRRGQNQPRREAETLLRLFQARRDLGRLPEARSALEEALALLRPRPEEGELAAALAERAALELDAGSFAGVDEWIAELETMARTLHDRRALGLARQVAAYRDGLRDERESSRAGFDEARRILRSQGDADLADRAALVEAELSAAIGDVAGARGALATIDRTAAATGSTVTLRLADRIEARLEALEPSPAGGGVESAPRAFATESPAAGLHERMEQLWRKASRAAADGRSGEARDSLQDARECASKAGRRIQQLAIDLEVAALAPATDRSRARIASLETEARSAGLTAIAQRARSLLR